MARGIDIGSGDPSPWANEQPVPAAPIDFDWAPSRSAPDEWAPTGRAGDEAPPEPAERQPVSAPPDHQADDRPPPTGTAPRRRLAAIAGLGVVAVIVGVLVLVRDDPPISPAAEGPDVTEPVSTERLPTTIPPVRTSAPDVIGSGSTDTGASGDGIAGWTETTIDLPAAVRAISVRTTVVAINSDGEFMEIDLPTGRIDSIQLPRLASSSQLVVGQSTALLAGYTGGGPNSSWLLRVGEDPVPIELDQNRDQMVAVPMRDEYVGLVYGFSGPTGEYRETKVFGDGTTETTSLPNDAPPWQRRYAPTGELLITDAGGVYRFDDLGAATRISDGTLVTSSSHHLLVRECDAAHVCAFVLIDAATGERRVTALGDEFDHFIDGNMVDISPDGRTMHFVSFGPTSTEERLVDLDTGETIELETAIDSGPGADVWVADSSGVLRPSGTGGMLYIERSTGRATQFGEELGRIQSASVRVGSGAVTTPTAGPITSGLAIVGLGLDGDVHRIDIDTGAVISTSAPPLASGSPAYVFADPEGATIASFDNVPSIRLDAASGTASLTTTNSPTGPMFAGPLPGTVWQPRQRARPDAPLTLDLVDSFGTESGLSIEVGTDSELLGSDGAGGVLVTSELGGVYAIAPDGTASRLTSGEVLALGPTVAYVRECDDQLVCGVVRLDRATGERVPVVLPALELAGADAAAGGPFGHSVSPDGDVAFVRVDGFGAEWTMIDLVASTAVPLPGASVASPVLWSADSQWALYLSGDVLRIYDRAAGSLRTLTNLPELKAFGAAVAIVADTAATGEATTEPPVTEPPVTEPPVTEPPVTEPGVTEDAAAGVAVAGGPVSA